MSVCRTKDSELNFLRNVTFFNINHPHQVTLVPHQGLVYIGVMLKIEKNTQSSQMNSPTLKASLQNKTIYVGSLHPLGTREDFRVVDILVFEN